MRIQRLPRLAAALLLVAGAFTLSAPAMAGGHGGHGGPGGPEGPFGFGRELFMQERMAAELGLDDKQRAAIEKVIATGREQARPYVKQMLEQHRALREQRDGDTFDEAAVRAQVAKMQSVMTELAVIRARTDHEARKLLTPAQRDTLKEMHGHHHRRSE